MATSFSGGRKYALHQYIMYILRTIKHTTAFNGPGGSMS
jgi:hypothetical protein